MHIYVCVSDMSCKYVYTRFTCREYVYMYIGIYIYIYVSIGSTGERLIITGHLRLFGLPSIGVRNFRGYSTHANSLSSSYFITPHIGPMSKTTQHATRTAAMRAFFAP